MDEKTMLEFAKAVPMEFVVSEINKSSQEWLRTKSKDSLETLKRNNTLLGIKELLKEQTVEEFMEDVDNASRGMTFFKPKTEGL